jgi:hypothetical protein
VDSSGNIGKGFGIDFQNVVRDSKEDSKSPLATAPKILSHKL